NDCSRASVAEPLSYQLKKPGPPAGSREQRPAPGVVVPITVNFLPAGVDADRRDHEKSMGPPVHPLPLVRVVAASLPINDLVHALLRSQDGIGFERGRERLFL